MKTMNLEDILYSNDQVARKYIQSTKDNYDIETLFVDYHNKYIICFSTQIGCNLGCRFCYNGICHSFIRNLTKEEIVEQIENVLNKETLDKEKPILFSAMGIGEPLLNYDNLIAAIHTLNEKYPGSKFALATTGVSLTSIVSLATDLADIPKFKLTISLHSVDDSIRKYLMPASGNIKDLIEAVELYKELSNREVEWNYVLFKGINDSKTDALKLAQVLGKDEFIKINKFNPVDISDLRESDNLDTFIGTLKNAQMDVEYYQTNGSDINGACGQMVMKKNLRNSNKVN